MKNCGALFVFVSLFCFGIGGKLPSTFNICKRHDPELEDCFAKAIKHALPYLKEPIPELGLLSVDPVKIDKIQVASGSSSSVNITQTFHNVKIYNVVDSTINKTEITYVGTNDFKILVYFYDKLMKVECQYEMEGKILLLPIVGHGDAHLDFYDMEGVITMIGVFNEKKGKTYAKLNEVSVDLNPGKIKLQFDNLFNGNERLGNEMNKLLNENWKELSVDIKPAYTEALGIFFKSIFGAVFDRVPYDELFPL